MSRISRAMSRPLSQSAEPTTRMSTPSAADQLGGLAVDPAVDVDLAAVELVRQVARAPARSFALRDVGHERLAAEARLDGHDHHDVEELPVRLERGERRLRA